jgi:putative aldouronate transport system permease protein
MIRESKSRRTFLVFNNIILIFITSLCLLPMLHILALSFSSSSAAAGGVVGLLPVNFTLQSYKYVMERVEFWQALFKSAERVLIGVPLNMFLTIITAYALSKERSAFRMRTVYVWILFATMLFSGGLIPGYLLIQNLGLMDSIWALVLPVAVPVYNIILMLNFFRGIPKELEEASLIDGANHLQTCFKIYVPCALPSIATLTLFSFVNHWNSWFDGLIFSNFPGSYPLSSYLQTVVIKRDMSLLSMEDYKNLMSISDRTIHSAQIFMGVLPILIVYPFVQKYFVKGIVVGSVKG